ncbi:hypothetical protein [Nocardioides sp.]|uniref:hypothetical protein n=1 Tax=Nocardioides sp. TaxID=35761 RepID=UPI002603BE4E|nr:hypothetical protein [Nocardioides sp.]MDI6908636.1 hypothetical protein [Nocardioides sp.]
MARAGLYVTGLAQVTRALREVGVEVDDLKNAFAAIAAEGARLAAGFAPMRSGRLARDIRGNRAKSKAVVTAGRASVPYAGPINYGWPARNIAASGYMQKASTAMEPVALRRLADEIDNQIKRRGL